jgi:hypothetical protein
MLTTQFPPEPVKDNLAAPPPWLGPAAVPGPEDMLGSPGPGEVASVPAELVLVFASTTEVLNAEDRLEAGDFNFALIPVPKEVNPNCGLALSFPEEIAPDIDRALARAGLGPVAVYRRLGGEFSRLPQVTGFFTRPAEPE